MDELSQLRERIAQLEAQLQNQSQGTVRQKVEQMSAEVIDSNPYRYKRQ